MKNSFFLIILAVMFASCSNSLLVQIKKSQNQYFSNQNIGDTPNDMLESLHEARKYILNEKINHKNSSDTIFIIEGYSIETGITYSTIWSSTISPINYKSHFGRNVEVINENLFEDDIKEKVSQLKFEELPKVSTVQDGNLYIATAVLVKDDKTVKIIHSIFEEPSL